MIPPPVSLWIASKPRDGSRACQIAIEQSAKIDAGTKTTFTLQLLLGVRIGEAVGGQESEFDLDGGTWTFRAERTKSGREPLLPLSPWVIQIIKGAMAQSRSLWLFPGKQIGS